MVLELQLDRRVGCSCPDCVGCWLEGSQPSVAHNRVTVPHFPTLGMKPPLWGLGQDGVASRQGRVGLGNHQEADLELGRHFETAQGGGQNDEQPFGIALGVDLGPMASLALQGALQRQGAVGP